MNFESLFSGYEVNLDTSVIIHSTYLLFVALIVYLYFLFYHSHRIILRSFIWKRPYTRILARNHRHKLFCQHCFPLPLCLALGSFLHSSSPCCDSFFLFLSSSSRFLHSSSTLLSLLLSLSFSICDMEPGPYLMCSSFSISISWQVASGAMLEPAPPTPPIYLPCVTPRMATCLWMVAMLTMSQVRFLNTHSPEPPHP